MARSLYGHPDFMKLWMGQTISVFGAQFSPVAIQYASQKILNAGALQFGVLYAMGTLPFLIFGLPVGVWADRYRRRRTMIYANVGRALILLSVPLAYLTGYLSIEEFYVVAFSTGVLTVFFEICYQSYLPTIVERSELVDANSKLQTSQASASGVGPALAGALIAVVSAPLAILGDVVGYFSSAGFLSSIRKPESVLPKESRGSALTNIREGLSIVAKDPRLRSIAGCTATANLFFSAYFAILVPFEVLSFGFGSIEVGLVYASQGIGGILGALVSKSIPKRIGVGRTILLGSALFTAPAIGLYFASGANALAVLMAVFGTVGFAGVVYNVSQVSFRQALVSINLQGRINATNRTIVWGTIPAGGIIGGVLADALGYRTAVGIAAAFGVLAVVWILMSPVRRIGEIPSAPEIDSQEGAPGA